MPCTCKRCLFGCFCWPIVLPYHACRIYCCGCIGVFFATLIQAFQSCCCACWACLCCACCGCSSQYVDKDFPASAKSLGENTPGVEWLRLEDYFEEQATKRVKAGKEKEVSFKPRLFAEGISSNDVSQGSLGDCWLLSTMAALAEFPVLIRKLFKTKRHSIYGKYTVRIFDAADGSWEEVDVDTFIPVKSGSRQPLYADMNGEEMWAVLLEKALAKFCGSFSNLEGGHSGWALRALTGYPTFTIKKNEGEEWRRYDLVGQDRADRRGLGLRCTAERYTHKDVFDILCQYDEKRAIMCCSSLSGSDTEKTQHGIVKGHAYTLLSARKVGDFMLLQLRNPWGSGEWKGDWSDESDMWRRHPNVKEELEFKPAEDGAFWITVTDFCANFRAVHICVRDTGFDELEYDPKEDMACCGPCAGCCAGCCCFWCGCRGCKALCCGETASGKTLKPRRGCCSCCDLV